MLAALHFALVANSAELHREPDDSARVLAQKVKNTDLFIIENTGEWSRVVNTKTGLVGWTKLPLAMSQDEAADDDNDNMDEEDSASEDDDADTDISGMRLAAR
jgi:hypothetical protein